MSDCCLAPIQQFFSYIMARTSITKYRDALSNFKSSHVLLSILQSDFCMYKETMRKLLRTNKIIIPQYIFSI
jgi:hypothetical protein